MNVEPLEMRSVLPELFPCPRLCRRTEFCYGTVWLVFALPKVLAVLRRTKLCPPAPHTRLGVTSIPGWPGLDHVEMLSWEGLVSSWPIPIFPHAWLGLEHSLWLDVEDFRAGKTQCLLLPMPRSFLCEVTLQVTLVTSEMLPGTQQR